MSIRTIKYRDNLGNQSITKVSEFPDICPVCEKSGKQVYICAHLKEFGPFGSIEAVFQCPRNDCESMFIVRFQSNYLGRDDYYILNSFSLPTYREKLLIPETVTKISERFSRVYSQATIADRNNLNEISGAGYRRALEILIKDYLIRQSTDIENSGDVIAKKSLGKCIESIENVQVRTVATRAAWIGNDEAHYYKKWKDRDVEDLKTLLKLVIGWIDAEEMTKNYLEEMPENKKPT